MTIGPPNADFPTIVSTLAHEIGRDGLAWYRDFDALTQRDRRLHDRLAGTCLVPRPMSFP